MTGRGGLRGSNPSRFPGWGTPALRLYIDSLIKNNLQINCIEYDIEILERKCFDFSKSLMFAQPFGKTYHDLHTPNRLESHPFELHFGQF